MAPRLGAAQQDWQRFVDLGLTDDLLPVVSDTSLQISPRSRMGDVGKTPSLVSGDGHIVGIPKWTERTTTAAQARQWAKDGRLGICLQTRVVRALDVDIADAAVSAQVRELVELVLGELPCRSRANSGKLLLAFRLAGAYTKRKIKTAHGGPIEFLATGQQFIAAGTHPSGARYEWQGLDAGIPEVSAEDFEVLWASLSEIYGVEPVDTGAREATSHNDPVRGLSDDDLRAALAVLDPDMAYDDWVKVGQAIHHETRADGIGLWDEWSAAGSEYPGRDVIEAKWASFGRNSGAVVTAGTLLHMANTSAAARGTPLTLPSQVATADEFPLVEAEPGVPGELPTFKRDKRGAIEPTVTNTVLAVGRPDVIGLRLAHDQFRDDMLVGHPQRNEWRPITDADMVSIRMALERTGFKAAPKELTRDAAVRVAADNVFDTAINWAESLHWDGVPRVGLFLTTYLGVEDTPYTRAVSRYLWTAMAGRALVPGVQADMAPILQGGQGLGKTSLIRALVPSPEFYVEVDFNTKEEDTVRSLRGALVAEIAELSGLHTRALEGIKKFMTRRVEKWIPKFKEFATTFARRVVFIGTTNDVEILADSTGNRRWLPVTVTKADVEGVERDRLQLWAEGAALFKREGVAWQEAVRLADAAHEHFRIADSWEDAITAWLNQPANDFDDAKGAKNCERPFTTGEVLRYALGIVTGAQDRALQNRAARALRALGYESMAVRVPGEHGPVRRWVQRIKRVGNGTGNVTSVTCNLV